MVEFVSRQDAIARKLPTYFVGRKCKRGHVSAYFTGSGVCCECRKIYLKDRRYKDRTSVVAIIEANHDYTWEARCVGGSARFRFLIGDVSPYAQRHELDKMVVGQKIIFDLVDGFPEDVELL